MDSQPAAETAKIDVPFDATRLERPDDSLLTYYLIISLATTIAFPFVFVPLLIRFKTMRYQFDSVGVSMCWGYFFRREVYLTYARLQDIHVTRNIVERWMGLAKLPIQTASGASGATMCIEGIRNPEPLRDYLYTRMRDVREEQEGPSQAESSATDLLREIRDCLRVRGQASEGSR
jgi:putative membrane protein